jgi:hypothetical protein
MKDNKIENQIINNFSRHSNDIIIKKELINKKTNKYRYTLIKTINN